MDNQPWLDSVREQLARRRLPPSYVQRFTEELSDHLEDLRRRWMLVSCTALAAYIAVLFSRQTASATYATDGHGAVSVGLVMCLILGLGQALVPLAIAWWFMRRKHGQAQLELES
jgi:hypothetical protein